MERNPTIKIQNLTTGYHGKSRSSVVARDINASLYSHELTCMLGPNGAGKSTLLKTLSGFLPPLGGTIILNGQQLCDYTDTQLAKVVSVVLTDRIAVSNMTVAELVGLGRSPYTGFWGTLDNHDHTVVDEALNLVGINHLAKRMLHTLSDGERQKVMIAKSLAQETPIIFLDEPTAFLDYPSKVEIMQLLHTLSRVKGKTIFMSTHDLELALQIADKIWLVNKTEGLSIGTPEDLSLNGSLERFFSRKGISFDHETGFFTIDRPMRQLVNVNGSGPLAAMARKALRRIGILSSDKMSAPYNVTAAEKTLEIEGKHMTTIQDLLNTLNPIIESND